MKTSLCGQWWLSRALWEHSNIQIHVQIISVKNFIAVVGPSRSFTSVFAAKIGRIFAVPVVSYFATSHELSDTNRFPFFFRTVPSDRFQVKAIVDILRHFNWKYVALLHSFESYGIHGANDIIKLADLYDICIAFTASISEHRTETELGKLTENLIKHDQVYVIIGYFTSPYTAEVVLSSLKSLRLNKKFVFIRSDGWGPTNVNREFHDILVGGIFTQFYSKLSEQFKKYYLELPLNRQNGSPWYKQRIEEILNTENCTDLSKCPVPKPFWNTQQVINAVHVIAYALNASLQNDSNGQELNGWILRNNLFDVLVPSGVNEKIQLDENGEVPGKYLLTSWQSNNGLYELVDIGVWDSHKNVSLDLNEEKIQWGTSHGNVPTSQCADVCDPGAILVPLKGCCLRCERCDDYAIVIKDGNVSSCQDCPSTHWPTENFTKCSPIQPTFLKLEDTIFMLSVGGAVLGVILIVLTMIGIYFYFWTCPY